MATSESESAVSFGVSALLVVESPSDPARAIGRALRERGVEVPPDWADRYHAEWIDSPPGAAVPLPAHVSAALSAAGVEAPANAPRRAVIDAFDPTVETRAGARAAVEAARDRGPVGLIGDTAAPALLRRVVIRADLDRDAFDATVSAAACGWRLTDRRAFDALARQLGVPVETLTHVTRESDHATAVREAGGTVCDLREKTLDAVADELAE